VSCFFDGVVLKLSGKSGETLAKVAVGDGAAGLASYGQNYLVANNGSNSITVFTADGTVISNIKVGRSPLYVAANAYGYWIANTGSDTVSKR
jgi:DNA-binding beta-propeller fold protein YncE